MTLQNSAPSPVSKLVEPRNDSPASLGSATLPPDLEAVQLAGQGSFCEIWKVYEPATGRCHALKQLRSEWTNEPRVRQLLVNEAIAGRAVDSRHVVKVERVEHEAIPPFNLLEWIEGETLDSQLTKQRLIPAGTAVWIARQCAQGLNDLAGAGYAHGDIKPQNIFLDTRGEVRLIDLGFAQSLDESPAVLDSRSMTGTPEYMAPETFSRGIINPVLRDMYSLGVTMYQMLSGRLPFESKSARQVLRLHCTTRPPSLDSLCEGVPAGLLDLVSRLLAKQPIRRPQSYTSLIRELTSLELATLHTRYAA